MGKIAGIAAVVGGVVALVLILLFPAQLQTVAIEMDGVVLKADGNEQKCPTGYLATQCSAFQQASNGNQCRHTTSKDGTTCTFNACDPNEKSKVSVICARVKSGLF